MERVRETKWGQLISQLSMLEPSGVLKISELPNAGTESQLRAILSQSKKTSYFTFKIRKDKLGKLAVQKYGPKLSQFLTTEELVKIHLPFKLNFSEVAERIHVTREAVRQHALKYGLSGRKRIWTGKVRRAILSDRPACPRCGDDHATLMGFSKLGQRRALCQSCHAAFAFGPRMREPIKMSSEFYSRIALMGLSKRWGGDYFNSGRLVYPYITKSSENRGEYDLVSEVNKAVRKNLPEDVRADVCQEIILQILDGKEALPLFPEVVSKYVKMVYKQHGYDISLDSISRDGDRTLGVRLGIY